MKDTFLNLQEEKRKTIEQALLKEFTHHPLTEASVKSIVEEAGIPRGSFYQYFQDLQEAYFYTLSTWTKDTHTLFFEVNQEKCDLEETLQIYGTKIVEEILQADRMNLYKFRFLYGSEHVEQSYAEFLQKQKKSGEQLLDQIGTNKEEIFFLKAIVHDLIRRAFTENWTHDEFLSHYRQHTEWILGGLNYGKTI